MLHFDGVDDNATVYLNGQRLGSHQGWDLPFDVNLAPAWKAGGPNVLAVLVENTAGAGGWRRRMGRPVPVAPASSTLGIGSSRAALTRE
jgi:hypothetical protein